MKMNTYETLKMVLDYCKTIDRNGSWDEVFNSLLTGDSTLLEELNTLEMTLSEWLVEESSIGVDTYKTMKALHLVQCLKEEL
jgi:hypothetical protein